MLGLHTEYMTVINHDKRIIDKGPCFHNVFNYRLKGTFNANTVIKIYTINPIDDRSYRNNYLLLTIDEVEFYLNELKEVVPFKYKILNKDTNDFILVAVETNHLNHYEFKFLLSSIRHLWEFPQSATLKESFALKQLGYFADINIFDVFNIVARVICPHEYNDQMILRLGDEDIQRLMSKEEMRSRLQSASIHETKLDEFYPTRDMSEEIERLCGAQEDHFANHLEKTIESNFSEELLRLRYDTYYKIIYNYLKS